MDHDMFNWLLMELEIEQDIECQLEIENELISRWLELEIKFEEVTRVEREQGITARVHEVKCELQAIRLPSLILEQLRSRLDDGTKRNQGKRKLHGYERGYDILKERLHQLKRQFEEIQESKWKLEREADECRRWSVRWHVRAIEPKLYFLKCEFMQKLRELNRWQKEILLKVAYLDSLLVWLLVLYAVHAEDAHEGGGFKNLLDGWWLEFWEIVLLAAGDVERNPGPRQITDDQLAGVSDTPIEEDDLSLIFDAVRPISSKWSRLCCSLGLRASLLDTIEKNHPRDVDDCLFEGLKRWILKNYDTTKHGLPTWRRLVEAVDNSSDNHALALKIAEEHKKSDVLPVKQGSVAALIPTVVCSDPKKSQAMSTAFANMYRAISRPLPRSVQANELKEFLRCFCHPQSPRQLCVDPRVYKGATSTKDILEKLCPEYINPAELFVLEGIVETFGSRQCKKLLRDFQDKFH